MGEKKEQRDGQEGGAEQMTPEKGSHASETPGSVPSDVPPGDAAGVSGAGGEAAAAADATSANSVPPGMAEGVGRGHAGDPNMDGISPREEEMDVGDSAGQSQDFPGGVEIIIEGRNPVDSPIFSPFVAPIIVGDILSSEEEEDQDDMEDEDSDGSLECGQQMESFSGSETQLLGKRTRIEGEETGSEEESSLHIASPGVSEEGAARSPGLRRRQREGQEDSKSELC